MQTSIAAGRRHARRWIGLILLVVMMTASGALALAGCRRAAAPPALTQPAASATPAATVTFGIALPTRPSDVPQGTIPTRTPEPIIPTATALTATATATALTALRATPDSTPEPADGLIAEYARFGVGGPLGDAVRAHAAGLPFSHLLDWRYRAPVALPAGVTYWRMVRLSEAGLRQPLADVERVARANPGSIWIIGNEPDVRWQDDVTPETYARLYGELYVALKAADPTAKIAPAGVAQGTPLRLAYLDRVLAAYAAQYGTPLPADIWTIHAFTLREERDSWGVDIPAGIDVNAGELYEIDEHDDLDLFRENLINFRRWMAQNGYRDRPLAVTEMGILLPSDYGFPPALVQQYMRDTYDILLTLSDEAIGLPADGNRLVQTWFWYIVYDPPDRYPVGNLFDPLSGQLTPLGHAHRDYLYGR